MTLDLRGAIRLAGTSIHKAAGMRLFLCLLITLANSPVDTPVWRLRHLRGTPAIAYQNRGYRITHPCHRMPNDQLRC
jgi:hypothetical protein